METTTKIVCNTALVWSHDDVDNNIGSTFPEYEGRSELVDYFQEIMEEVIEDNFNDIVSTINEMIRSYIWANEEQIKQKIESILNKE